MSHCIMSQIHQRQTWTLGTLLELEQRELKKIIQSLPSGHHTRFTIHPLAALSFQIILRLTIDTTLDFISLHRSSSTSKGLSLLFSGSPKKTWFYNRRCNSKFLYWGVCWWRMRRVSIRTCFNKWDCCDIFKNYLPNYIFNCTLQYT
jgi:hypothetical protein